MTPRTPSAARCVAAFTVLKGYLVTFLHSKLIYYGKRLLSPSTLARARACTLAWAHEGLHTLQDDLGHRPGGVAFILPLTVTDCHPWAMLGRRGASDALVPPRQVATLEGKLSHIEGKLSYLEGELSHLDSPRQVAPEIDVCATLSVPEPLATAGDV